MRFFPEGWNGYRYWMALTPYADSNDDLENPAILVSNDNVTWTPPFGAPDPLDYIFGTNWNADTELVMDDTGRLHCFWRYWDNAAATGTLMRRTTTDGIHWTPREVCNVGVDHNWTSPGIVLHDGTWHAWVERTGTPKQIAYLTAPDPLGPWSAAATCTLNGFPSGREPWHLGVTRWRGQWWMAVSDGFVGSTGSNGRILVGRSNDGLNWNMSAHVIGQAPAGAFDSDVLYRPTLYIEGDVAHLWYGASTGGGWRIGYTTLPLMVFPEAP